jgi:hypothetical protein
LFYQKTSYDKSSGEQRLEKKKNKNQSLKAFHNQDFGAFLGSYQMAIVYNSVYPVMPR